MAGMTLDEIWAEALAAAPSHEGRATLGGGNRWASLTHGVLLLQVFVVRGPVLQGSTDGPLLQPRHSVARFSRPMTLPRRYEEAKKDMVGIAQTPHLGRGRGPGPRIVLGLELAVGGLNGAYSV